MSDQTAASELDRIRNQMSEDFDEALDSFLVNAQNAVRESEGRMHTSLRVVVGVRKKVKGEDELDLELTFDHNENIPKPKRTYKLDLANGKQLVLL